MHCRASITIGRDAEMQVVAAALEAARRGRGGAVVLVGEAGIGKTRLSLDAADLAGQTGMRLLRGRGSNIGPPVPFRPIAEAVLSLLRLAGLPDAEALGPYRPVLGRLAPQLGEPPAAGDTSLVVLGEALLRLLAQSGAPAGCLVFLDDIHDADPESLALIDYLMDNLSEQPAALLCAVRDAPSTALDLVRAAAQRGCCTLVELDRLSRDDLCLLIGSGLGVDEAILPDAVADLVWADSAGNPYVAEELVGGLISTGSLVREGDSWRLTGPPKTSVPMTLTRVVTHRLDTLRPQGRALLSAAAVLGSRFPVSVAQSMVGLGDVALADELQDGIDAQLIRLDEEPGWYQFHHPLTAKALLTRVTPDARAATARTGADVIEARFPGLPGQWCQLVASLRLQAGETRVAGRLFGECGRRALAAGAANSAVSLLRQALDLHNADPDPDVRASLLESMLTAMAEAGLVEDALACSLTIDEFDGLDPIRRAALYTRLAMIAAMAGRAAQGFTHAERARALLGPSATPMQIAPIDLAVARLSLDTPDRDRLVRAEALLRRAAAVAESGPLPVVACQAWQVLGSIIRSTDPDDARACLERAHAIAVRHELPVWELHVLVRLGGLDALYHADTERLERARHRSLRVGAVLAGYEVEVSLALFSVLRGDVDAAAGMLDRVLGSAIRLKVTNIAQYGLMTRVILAAHRGRRRDMDAAMVELDRWYGVDSHHAPLLYGLGRGVCALLEEDRARAVAELDRAMAMDSERPTPFTMYGRYGLRLLLDAVDGKLDRRHFEALAADPACRQRWNLHFVALADAVLLGRAGRHVEARATVHRAGRIAEPYQMAKWLGLRLICDVALADGWGELANWLPRAEQYFHEAGIQPVAGACRALLRRAGKPVNQRRRGHENIPHPLRSVGVTPRECEVLQLIAHRHANRVIAGRLHISPRTVEKHVANLLMKTGQPDRTALGQYAESIMRD